MTRAVMLTLFAVFSVLSLQHECAGRHLAAEPPKASGALSEGLGPFLQQSPQYSLFLKLVVKQDLFASDVQNGFFEGPTNQTILLVNNKNIYRGFIQLAAQYNISKPDTFLDRLIDIETSTLAPGQGDNPTYTKANYANILLRAFVGSHVLPRPAEAEPQDIYSNQTILQASYQRPITLETGISDFYNDYGYVQAYTATNAPGPATIYLRQEGGLRHDKDGLAVPRSFLTATGRNEQLEFLHKGTSLGTGPCTIFVYELDDIFLYGEKMGPANVFDYSGKSALTYFSKNGI